MLTAMIIGFALIADLTLLPALLTAVDRGSGKRAPKRGLSGRLPDSASVIGRGRKLTKTQEVDEIAVILARSSTRRMRTIMFNNPFDSFHKTVAAAKEEREQLDRLLTISTPRERLLVAGIAALLVILAAWLFLGSVARSIAVDGVLVEPGENPGRGQPISCRRSSGSRAASAPQIEAGMPAAIELAMATDREAVTLAGEVAAIAAVPLPEALADFEVRRPRIPCTASMSRSMKALNPSRSPSRECRVFIRARQASRRSRSSETGRREMGPGASGTASGNGLVGAPEAKGGHAHRAADPRGGMWSRLPRQRTGLVRALGAADRAAREVRGEPGRQQRGKHILRASRHYGLECSGLSVRAEQLKKLPLAADRVLAVQPLRRR